MDVSENRGTPKSSILIGFFHYFHHPFWGVSLFFYFGDTRILSEVSIFLSTGSSAENLATLRYIAVAE